MDVTVLAQQVSAIVLAAYGLIKAVIGLVDLIKRRKA